MGLWTAGILTTAWAAFTTIAIIYPGIGTAHPDDSLPSGFAGQRLEYTLTQVIPLVVMVLVGLLFYALGAPTRRQVTQADGVSSQAAASAAAAGEAPDGQASSGEASSDEAPSGGTASAGTPSSDGAAATEVTKE